MVLNKNLRLKIAQMVKASGEGHIPSSYSIVDLIDHLYGHVLRYNPDEPKWTERDYFVLSKGHGCGGLYVVLHKFGFLTDQDLADYSTAQGLLGGHPDMTCVPGVEASTGSLGHGFPTAMGTALGLRIQNRDNRVFALLGDGECHEGTIWESANVGANLKLGNLCAIVDFNGSAAQLMPDDNMAAKWAAFGWDVHQIDGHSAEQMQATFGSLEYARVGRPKVVIAHTVKGKGVSFTEGHGKWHHRIPNDEEMTALTAELLP
jgi:transketolase